VSVAVRLSEVRARIDAAARGAGRDPSSVRLVAVSKTFPMEAVREAAAAGQRDFGENRVQEALEKIESSTDLDVRWHLLGHVQTNKAKKAAAAFAMIQSVDGVELLRKLDAAAAESGRTPELLIQVDLAGEATKFGARPDEVPAILAAATTCRAARVVGLMTIPPIPDTPEAPRAARGVGDGRRSAGPASGSLDGNERRFRGGHPGRGHYCARGNGHFRQPPSSVVASAFRRKLRFNGWV